MTRDTVTAYRRRAADTERMVEAASAGLKAERDAAWKASNDAAVEAEATRVKYTADDLAGAVAVRDRYGWHRVVRVNRATVTVETGYSWTASIPVAKVLQFQGAKS